MAKKNHTEVVNIDRADLHDIRNRLIAISGELSCFLPVISSICERHSDTLSVSTCGQLEMVSSLSERINHELDQIAGELREVVTQ